uniref:Uncharacterized protein n=1 Tax=Anguilla anguilla TaxID=7936 RepID=A0A0E9RJM8_ANGAN
MNLGESELHQREWTMAKTRCRSVSFF